MRSTGLATSIALAAGLVALGGVDAGAGGLAGDPSNLLVGGGTLAAAVGGVAYVALRRRQTA